MWNTHLSVSTIKVPSRQRIDFEDGKALPVPVPAIKDLRAEFSALFTALAEKQEQLRTRIESL